MTDFQHLLDAEFQDVSSAVPHVAFGHHDPKHDKPLLLPVQILLNGKEGQPDNACGRVFDPGYPGDERIWDDRWLYQRNGFEHEASPEQTGLASNRTVETASGNGVLLLCRGSHSYQTVNAIPAIGAMA